MNTQQRLVSLLIGLTAAAATWATTITPAQQSKIKLGATMDEVQQTLGKPSRVQKVRFAPGPTWVYELNDGQHVKDYELDFHDGKVQWIEVRDYYRD